MSFPITCTACHKTFTISDEIYEKKVAGRVVTIKCKSCTQGIRVDGTKGATAGASTAPPAPAPAPAQPTAPPEEPLWAVDSADGQDREFTTAELLGEVRRGAVSAATLVWREGMAEWLEAAQVPELAGEVAAFEAAAQKKAEAEAAAAAVAAKAAAAKAAAAKATAAEKPAAVHKPRAPMPTVTGLGLPVAQKPRATQPSSPELPKPRTQQPSAPEMPTPRAAQASAPDMPTPRAAQASAPEIPKPRAQQPSAPVLPRPPAPPPPPIAAPAPLGSPFPLAASAPQTAPTPFAAPTPPAFAAATPPLPASVAQVVSRPPQPPSAFPTAGSGAMALGSTFQTGPALVTDHATVDWPEAKSKTPLIIVGLLVAAAAVGAGVLLLGGDKPPPPSTPISAAPLGPSPAINTPTSTSASTTQPGSETASGSDPIAAPSDPGATPGAGFAELFAAGARKAESKGTTAAPSARFDASATKAPLAEAATQAQACKQSGGPTGKVTVVVTFDPSGKVSSATITDAPFAGTAAATCISSALKRATITPFSGLPGTVSKTFTIL